MRFCGGETKFQYHMCRRVNRAKSESDLNVFKSSSRCAEFCPICNLEGNTGKNYRKNTAFDALCRKS